MFLYIITHIGGGANQSLLFLINAASLAKKHKYQFHSLWFDPIGLEPTIYSTLTITPPMWVMI
jgi:hypothetical protein